MNWAAFKSAAPALAEAAEALFDKSGVVLVGTLRKDGSPRISPVEPLLLAGELYLGMMPQSFKVADLLRDPRCTVHSTISDRHATEGEFKLHGCARNVLDAAERQRYCEGLNAKIGWSPEGMPFELFAVEVQSAGHFKTEAAARVMQKWRAGEAVHTFRQGIDGKAVEVTEGGADQ
ncbi:MAG: pyridoxamine 5'-phosphate oxidase family protein [Acidobacteria bacterium]|nr:pyridoxamine 5'-phosphate oxidase family protein [Acidobacteriota bacterium]MBI3423261.1 pyridoxamine 5'-phosphate oxidase family protein [Acidobacteriota bacterium]